MTDEKTLIEKVKETLNKVRPFLQQDGGDLEFVEMVGNEVRVRLKGACGHCPSANYTLKMGVEQVLREEVSPDIEVVSVK